MSVWKIAASVREFFVELVASSNDGSYFIRTLNRKDNLSSGLLEALASLPPDSISQNTTLIIQSDLENVVLREGWGEKTAFITTEGFENIFGLWNEARDGAFGYLDDKHFPKNHPRQWISSDFTFGLSCRMSADGSILKEIDSQELEQLISKLQLSEIKTVGVCLLHAPKNPKHEQEIQGALKRAGIEVIISHTQIGHERERAKAVLTQCLAHDHKQQFIKALTDLGLNEKNIVWSDLNHANTGTEKELLIEIYEDRTKATLINKGRPEKIQWLETTLMSQLIFDPIGWVQVGPSRVNSEPGPVSFGKGIDLCLLDALVLKENLRAVESPRIKTDVSRVEKAFQMISRQLKETAEQACSHYLKLGCNQITAELRASFSEAIGNKTPVTLAGTFGPFLKPYLTLRHLTPALGNEGWYGATSLLDKLINKKDIKKIGDFSSNVETP